MGETVKPPSHDLVPRPVGAQVGALEHAMLGQAVLGDGERQRRAVHGHVEVAQEIRQRPDVVLVAMGQDHAAEGRAAIAEIGEVGDHVVHPGHLVVREQEPAVDGDHVVARLDQHHVEPDLAQPSERDQAHGGRGRHIDRDGRRAVDGTHGGVAMVPPALGPTKKQDARLDELTDKGKARARAPLRATERPRAMAGSRYDQVLFRPSPLPRHARDALRKFHQERTDPCGES